MLQDIGQKFLSALADLTAQRFGPDDARAVEISDAAKAGDVAAARRTLSELDAGAVDALVAVAHEHLRLDTAAMLANWRLPCGSKPH